MTLRFFIFIVLVFMNPVTAYAGDQKDVEHSDMQTMESLSLTKEMIAADLEEKLKAQAVEEAQMRDAVDDIIAEEEKVIDQNTARTEKRFDNSAVVRLDEDTKPLFEKVDLPDMSEKEEDEEEILVPHLERRWWGSPY